MEQLQGEMLPATQCTVFVSGEVLPKTWPHIRRGGPLTTDAISGGTCLNSKHSDGLQLVFR
jgi:hypothetical protein